MKKIASHKDIDIFAPDNSRFSFMKSPYAAHKTFSAVDIYYGNFGGDAFSPVDGKVIDIKRFDTPTPFKDRDFTEYIIAIRQSGHVVKILHVEPDVSIDENISKGDRIGTFIHNGYFIFWNDPVMHVEIRHPGDYLRASNNLRLTPNIECKDFPSNGTIEIECNVEEINKRYALLSAPYEICGEIKGFTMDDGFLDGYISSHPEDSFFGIINPQGFLYPGISAFEITSGGLEVECAGIAFCLSFNEPRIKVIPVKYGDKMFSPGDKVRIRFKDKI